jgi:hypothetical protein
MTPEERERMNWLCSKIQTETDPNTFGKLVRELDALLEKEEDPASPRLGEPKSSF